MKTVLMMWGVAALSAALAATATYLHTREKWYDLGVNTGVIHGKAEVMERLAPLALKSPPPGEADYYLTVKASRISFVHDGDAVRLYLED